MINVYDGTLGALVDTDKIKASIINYIINNKEPLNYEMVEDNGVSFVCILGKNEEEKVIPIFQHPLVFEYKNENIVAIDYRLFTKTIKDDVINIQDILHDKYNGNLLMNRGILIGKVLSNEDGFMLDIKNNINDAFGILLSTTISNLIYDREIIEPTRIVSTMHASTNDLEVRVTLNDVLDKLSMKDLSKLKNGDLDYILKSLETLYKENKIDFPSKTIYDLMNLIRKVNASTRINKLDVDILIGLFGNSFYSVNSKDLAIAMIESRLTFTALLYSVMTEGINSKSQMRKILNARKSVIKINHVVDVLKKVFKESKDIV